VSRLAEFGRAPLARVLLIAGLALLLQVPSCAIGQLTHERQRSRDDAVAEVSRTWGMGQQLAGPFLVVPYRVEAVDPKGGKSVAESGTVVLLPERLELRAQARVETLRRGLFRVPVYRVDVRASGRFPAAAAELGTLPREALRLRDAQLVLRLSDARAIDRAGDLRVGGAAREFRGGTGMLGGSGLHAPIADLSAAIPADFSIDLSLRGSSSLSFTPTAKALDVALASDWPHPKFTGARLPDRREVSAQGFTANWALTSLAGGFPTAARREPTDDALGAAAFGVQLLDPVDAYRMSERSLKYDLLFTGLTFVVLWLFELRARRAVHPVQYVMLGAALCLFYLLELSLAEHLGFGPAYALAACAVTGQVSLYALLYLLLGAEDYALLSGSATLFVVLSAAMFLTRDLRPGGASGETAPGQ
jgi:inner membrane protein